MRFWWLLLLCSSADSQDLPGDEAGILAAEEADHGSLFFGGACALEWSLGDHPFFEGVVVSTKPGATALTLMFASPSSAASVRTIASIPAFAAE